MKPILLQIIERKKIYPDIQHPSDGALWISKMSPEEFLDSLNDPDMSILVKEVRVITANLSEEWVNPKAVGSVDLAADWQRKEEWAKMILNPSLINRMEYYKPFILLLIMSILISGVGLMILATYKISIAIGMSTNNSVTRERIDFRPVCTRTLTSFTVFRISCDEFLSR